METEKIEQMIIQSGATIHDFSFTAEIKGVIIEQDGLHVGIRPDLEARERKAVLAHELGHIKKGGLYQIGTPPLLKQKAECLSDRYAAELLASPEDVRTALKHGIRSAWELADYFEIPYDVMNRIIDDYKTRSVI
jgi:Zn-dependent peptidase ImmA (M78 family)